MTRRGLVGAFQGDQVRIDRSTFNEVHGHLNHYHIKGDLHNHENEHGLYALSNVISAGALHDAIERCPPPKCHPETRKEVRRIIMSWIEDPDSLADIIWIHGPAGVGKSAIAQSIAEWCRSSNKHLAASFFFLRGKPGRDECRYLFPTIAYQLALHVPGLREHVNRAMSADATLPSKDLETQLRKLIIEPLQKLSPPPQHPPCVIIDGIDECQIYETQKRILTLIADVLVTSKISLRFLIASRPEAHIRETFETSVLAQRTRRIVLDGTFQPDRDIRTYLIDGFVEIEERNQELMAHLPKPWPPKNIIDELVAKSSGQFIYAATVLKFVGADLHIPNTQLETVLQSPPARSTLFSNLDKLYSQILLTCPYRETLVRIFAIMLVLHCPQPPEVYDDILGVDGGHVRHTLRGMHSLIKFPNDFEDEEERTLFNQRQEYDQTCGLRFHHASFGDFLVDRSRSGQFFVDLIEAHTQLTKCGFQLLTDCIACPWRGLKGSHAPCPETWGYLKNHLHIHLSKCRESDRQSVIQALEEFKEDLLESMPAEDNSWNVAFPALHSLVTTLANTVTDDGDTLSGKFLHSEHSHWTQEVTFQSVLLLNRNAVKDQEVLELCLKYCKTLDDFYTFFFSKSDDMVRLLAYFPGFAVWKDRIPVDWLEDIFGAGRDVILADIQKNVRFIYRWESLFWIPFSPVPRSALDVVSLNAHISGFLSDRGRSGVYYQDPEVKQIGACRDLIKTIFRPGWLQAEKFIQRLPRRPPYDWFNRGLGSYCV
ncbi:hypothetical protein BDZ97DRAFT_66750 [Flammula alnicola]|nr:hypothetical protein BDZ97DRAFT_66750 [Flammula alnicola]